MSIRREAPRPVEAFRAPSANTAVALAPQTIGDRLGIERPASPAQWPQPFQPQYKEVPLVSESVVEDAFDGFDADPTGLFGKKKAADGAKVEGKKGGIVANLKAAKSKADAVVRKGVVGLKDRAEDLKAAKSKADAVVRKGVVGLKGRAGGIVDNFAGMQKFDYKVMSDDKFTGVLAVARKTNGGKDVDLANNIKAFKKYKHSKVIKQAEAQESRMLHREGLVKKKKGKEDKVVGRKAPGRNAAVLGYSQVQGGEEGGEEDLAVFNEYVYNPEAPAGDGVPTVVEMSEFDTNDVDGMMPITGLVVETLDTDELSFDGDTMTVTMQAVPEAKIEEQAINELTKDGLEFEYSLCVHGLYVGEDKQLVRGQKILVPKKEPNDIAAYGIATPNGIESALHHAMEGKVIDLLYLWTCFRLVQGVQDLAKRSVDAAQKAALKELLGESMGTVTQYTIKDDFEDDDFDELNELPLHIY
jgi:hypothetical protein